MKKYTVRELAKEYFKSEKTVRRWIKEGKIEAKKDKSGRCWLIIEKE